MRACEFHCLTATTAERFFRLDQAQEHLHYATDVFSEDLFIVYPELNVEDAAASSGIAVPHDRRRSHLDDSEKTSLPTDVSGHRPLHRLNAKRSVSSPIKTARYTHTHTHSFNGPLSGTTRVGQYQKGKTNLDFTEARDSEWQWHQLGRMQVYTLLQASTPQLSFLQAGCPSCRPTNSVKAL